MASTALNIGAPLLQFALIQDVLTVLIPVVTIGTGQVSSHVSLMRKMHWWSLLLLIDFHVFERNLLRLCTEDRDHHRRNNTSQNYCNAFPLHVLIILTNRDSHCTLRPHYVVPLLQPAFFLICFIEIRVHALRPANGSTEGDHAGNVDTDGAITTSAEHAIPPDHCLYPLQKITVDFSLLLI
jgi:hypothetical protein